KPTKGPGRSRRHASTSVHEANDCTRQPWHARVRGHPVIATSPGPTWTRSRKPACLGIVPPTARPLQATPLAVDRDADYARTPPGRTRGRAFIVERASFTRCAVAEWAEIRR